MDLPGGHTLLPQQFIPGIPVQERYAYHAYGRRSNAGLIDTPLGKLPHADAFLFHGAESPPNQIGAVSRFLRKEHGPNPEGVSATFAIEGNGDLYQMLGLEYNSGSLNTKFPMQNGRGLCKTESGFYGYSHASHVLGGHWGRWANHHVISAETGMYAADGPNDAVVETAVALFFALRRVFPKIVPLGHADFANCYKSCPGKTREVKAMFRRMGGHGKDYRRGPAPQPESEEEDMGTVKFVANQVATIKSGAKVCMSPGDDPVATVTSEPFDRPTFGTTADGKWRLIAFDDPRDPDDLLDRTGFVASSDVVGLKVIVPVDAEAEARGRSKALEEASVAITNAITGIPR